VDGAEKLEDDPIELLGALEAGDVSGSLDDLLASPGDLRRETIGESDEVGLILIADHDERRRPQLIEASGGRRVVEPGNRAGLGLALVRREDDLERSLLHCRHPLADAWIDVLREPRAG
jgi:hypothetical protein